MLPGATQPICLLLDPTQAAALADELLLRAYHIQPPVVPTPEPAPTAETGA